MFECYKHTLTITLSVVLPDKCFWLWHLFFFYCKKRNIQPKLTCFTLIFIWYANLTSGSDFKWRKLDTDSKFKWQKVDGSEIEYEKVAIQTNGIHADLA